MKRLFIMMMLAVGAIPAPAFACGNGVSCVLDNRSYQAKTPEGWDGRSQLPVLLHFHGWGRTGTNVIRNKRITGGTDSNGVLLLAPDGLGKSWSFWSERPQDINFAKAVLKDAAKQWPVDPERIYISGFSYGSAMAWSLACDSGDDYAGFLGIAGTLSNITSRSCPTGPFTLRQVHGETDTVMRPPWGANSDTWKKALNLSGCGGSERSKEGRFIRQSWTDCSNGHSVRLDIHDGGHFIPKGWINTQLRDLLDR